MNWVERNAARESNIVGRAPEIWQEVLTAIEDACNSFEGAHDEPTIQRSTENGHAMVVRATFPQLTPGIPRAHSVRIVFDERRCVIISTLDDKTPLKFHIDADETKCFLTYQDEKIDADRLSELVLSDVFLKEPTLTKPRTIAPRRRSWAKS